MSTFKIEGAKIVDWLFPELNWEALDFTKSKEVFEKLMSSDESIHCDASFHAG